MARDRFVSDDPRAPYKVIQGEKIAALKREGGSSRFKWSSMGTRAGFRT